MCRNYQSEFAVFEIVGNFIEQVLYAVRRIQFCVSLSNTCRDARKHFICNGNFQFAVNYVVVFSFRFGRGKDIIHYILTEYERVVASAVVAGVVPLVSAVYIRTALCKRNLI